jgi:hypothetical protein
MLELWARNARLTRVSDYPVPNVSESRFATMRSSLAKIEWSCLSNCA